MKIVVEAVRKEFGEGEKAITALDGLDFAVPDRQFLCVLGPSGCGKSTLLFITAGLERATAGRVIVDGRPVTGPGRDRGMLFQQFALFPWRTARDNIAFGLEVQRLPKY